MSSVEKQLEVLEIKMLLGRHRDTDRSAAAALVRPPTACPASAAAGV